uniref:NADH dehydrogenase subunit 6 n=1 Tax=Taenia multiceps TaxID=94034 RepID=C6KIC3_TAEMU|nr:NADH dehydrogenase subunit 6 [Taenia multiceps]ACS37256.1 NADH dehydrogenase subunit 6 [Taenia multiceps]
MVLEILVTFYFFILLLFSLSSHCVYYCVLLVINALVSCLICYLVYGFSWYSLVFCLVYVGGVYILFIFVSVFNPNDSFAIYHKVGESSIVLCFVIGLLCMCLFYSLVNTEFSNFLCTAVEGVFYVCLCLTLIFGFVVLSLLVSWKMNFYR